MLASFSRRLIVVEFWEKVGTFEVCVMLYSCAVKELVTNVEARKYEWLWQLSMSDSIYPWN